MILPECPASSDPKPCLLGSNKSGNSDPLCELDLDGLYCHADNLEAAEGWVDAILMAAHIAAGKQLPALAHALTVEVAP